MKTRWLVTGMAVAALAPLAIPFARTESKASQERPMGRLTRVHPQGSKQDDAAEFDRDEWKRQITAGDLAEREAAFDRLANAARHDAAARKALEDWSRDESDAGLAWTSRLILREVERGSGAWRQGGSGHPWLFRQDFDLGGFAQRFDDLDSMFGDLRMEWDELLKNMPNPSGGTTSTESAESMTLQSGPDGVTCKITTKIDGKEETREYTANSMEELLEANPELRPKLGSGGAMIWTFPNAGGRGRMVMPRGGGLGGGVRVIPRESFGLAEVPGNAADPRTDRLGIFCAPVDAEESAKLGLATGEGLRVDSVQPGTIAGILGLRAGDVVVEVNGTTIRSSEDVKKVLAERAEGAEVRVVVVGSEGRRSLAWKPAVKKADEKSKDL